MLINCHGGGTCNGGDPSKAYHYMSEKGLPEETCQNYEAVNGECKPMGICETCEPGDTPDTLLPGKCAPVANFSRWFVEEYGLVNAGKDTDVTGRKLRLADKIKAEIFLRGPVTCGIHASDEFVKYRGGIFKQFTPMAWLLDHEISLVGWGVENGEEFWFGRNSWGTWWGEQGLFRIAMHHFNLGVELECSWATPSVSPASAASTSMHTSKAGKTLVPGPTLLPGAWLVEAHGFGTKDSAFDAFDANRRHATPSTEPVLATKGRYSVYTNVKKGTFHKYDEPCLRRQKAPAGQADVVAKAEATARKVLDDAPLRGQARAGNVLEEAEAMVRKVLDDAPLLDLKGALSSDYEEAAMLAKYPAAWDVRNMSGVNFATIDKNQHIPSYCGSCWAQAVTSALSDRINLRRNNSFPRTVVAAQALVNCVTANETAGCRGGDPTAANSWMQENGAPDITCQAYQSKDLTCDAMGICEDCTFKGVHMQSVCSPVTSFPTARVASHGQLKGEAAMVKEIATRGPITCGLCVTPAFEAYASGVFVDDSGCTEEDHAISIAGYGVTADGQKYWIGRNSWGTYWGEAGWFRLARGTNNLGVEENCDWAEPAVTW